MDLDNLFSTLMNRIIKMQDKRGIMQWSCYTKVKEKTKGNVSLCLNMRLFAEYIDTSGYVIVSFGLSIIRLPASEWVIIISQ